MGVNSNSETAILFFSLEPKNIKVNPPKKTIEKCKVGNSKTALNISNVQYIKNISNIPCVLNKDESFLDLTMRNIS